MKTQGQSRLVPLIREKAQAFRKSYQETSRDIFSSGVGNVAFHNGEYGSYRERLLENLLRSFLPNYAGIGTGFILSRSNKTSTQVDIILYDSEETPKIEDPSLRRFFPIETCLAIGEVKSEITGSQLKQFLSKLKAVKKMTIDVPATPMPSRPSWRVAEYVSLQHHLALDKGSLLTPTEVQELLSSIYNPTENHWQNKISFLVCSSFKGGYDKFQKSLTEVISKKIPDEDRSMNHNMALSIQDGYQTYSINNDVHLYPLGWSDRTERIFPCEMSFIKANEECDHIIAFVSDLCSIVPDVAVYPFRASDYITLPRDLVKWK